MANLVPTERIDSLIFLLRGHKVMLDADLAELYGVELLQFWRVGRAKALNRAFPGPSKDVVRRRAGAGGLGVAQSGMPCLDLWQKCFLRIL